MSVLEQVMLQREQWCCRKEPRRAWSFCRSAAEWITLAVIVSVILHKSQFLGFLQHHLPHML